MQKLQVIYGGQEPPAAYDKAIYLMGPAPQVSGVTSWRVEAVRLLEAAGYDGVVFYPESYTPGVPLTPAERDRQTAWQERCLNMADAILYWAPRDPEVYPGYGSNVEWGVWQDSGKIVFGAPPQQYKNEYLEYYARKHQVPMAHSLPDTVRRAIAQVGEGSVRHGGEREVPLFVWRTEEFQHWYRALQMCGNVLEHARLVWTFRVGPNRQIVFFWVLHAEVRIAVEGRSKTNEVVLSRPDIATIVLYRKAKRLEDSELVLIREFRTPVHNPSGYVYEVPGGSSFKGVTDPLQLAAEECSEETGLTLRSERFVAFGARQMVATLSAHRAHLFAAELTDLEMQQLRDQQGRAFGVAEDTERTYVEIKTLQEICQQDRVDWSMLGMIMRVLAFD